MTTAISDALNLNHSLEQAQGRIDAELLGRGDTYLAPPEKPTPTCRRCGLPSMRRLGLFFGYAAALLRSEWSYRSKKIRSATSSWLITTAATMVTTFDTLRSESAPRTSSRSVINSWLTPQSLDVIAAPSSLTASHVRRACVILTTFDVIPSHLPRPDT